MPIGRAVQPAMAGRFFGPGTPRPPDRDRPRGATRVAVWRPIASGPRAVGRDVARATGAIGRLPMPAATTFEGYKLREVIGRGRMGTVYLAEDTVLARPVAVRILSGLSSTASSRERFLREARAIARLQHPNVVAIYRAGERGGEPYIVSELVRGGSLDRRDLPLVGAELRSVCTGLAAGLAAAHRRGVVHRDLKLANALVSESGEVKLCDFGLARLSEPEEDDSATDAAQADLRALATIFYQLASGVPAPAGTVPPLAAVAPGVDARLGALVDRCLGDPATRPASADEVHLELVALAMPRPSGAARPGRRWLAAGLAATAALTLALSWAATRGATRPRTGGPLFGGVWMAVPERTPVPEQFQLGLELDAFTELVARNRARGLVLIGLRTYEESGRRKWSGVWRTGSEATELSLGLDEPALARLQRARRDHGLRLVDLETYVDHGTRSWAALWRAGDDANEYTLGLDLASFEQLAARRRGQRLRLVDVVTYAADGARKWGGVWRSGDDREIFAADLDEAAVEVVGGARHKEGLQVLWYEAYDDGGTTRVAGLWRGPLKRANYYEIGLDAEALTGYTYWQRSLGNRALIALSVAGSNCPSSCMNQVVMPDDPSTPWPDRFELALAATAQHCQKAPGTCPAAAPGAVVHYRAPVDVEGTVTYARLSAILPGCDTCSEELLTLPFSDPEVSRRATWLSTPGHWHHALDYARDDRKSFDVEASAPGKVIYAGWDPWWGNTVVVSHDFNLVADAYRTIYTQLRGEPLGDCENAWTKTVPTLSGTVRAQYEAFLAASGCPRDGARHPGAKWWGESGELAAASLVGASVQRGQLLGQAGQTGPAGCGCIVEDEASHVWDGAASAQLHVLYARRDVYDSAWYLFDPYGIYAAPGCYPASTRAASDSGCARYPSSWLGKRPQVP
jgi:hypothetical protein